MGIRIEAPPVRATPGGLYAVSTVVDSDSANEFYEGVQYSPEACGLASVIPERCLDAYVTLAYDTDTLTVTLVGAPDGGYSVTVGSVSGEIVIPATPSDGLTVAAGVHQLVVRNEAGGVVASGQVQITDGELVSPASGLVKQFDGIDWVEAKPVSVYKGVECDLLGGARGEYEIRAARGLELGESAAVERYFWDSVLPVAATDLNPSGAVSVVEAAGLLDEYAASVYGGTPVLHVGRRATISLFADSAIDGSPGTLFTVNGTIVANGAGYTSLVGPGGVVAGADEVWAYITGQTMVRRGKVEVAQAPALLANQQVVLAERRIIPSFECFAVAVRIDLSGS